MKRDMDTGEERYGLRCREIWKKIKKDLDIGEEKFGLR